MITRARVLIITTSILVLLLLIGGLFYVRALRQRARANYYAQLAGTNKQDIQITIPEGWRREQIAALLEKKGVTGAEDFLSVTTNDEGHLWPDTYRFFPAIKAQTVRDELVATYDRKTADKVNNEVLIIASIVEREAKKNEERADIAGVYWNRYRAGYTLTADPTVQYGHDNIDLQSQLAEASTTTERGQVIENFTFWRPITRADYDSVDSPYNTYRNTGLPPGPICNPGLASLAAALKPSKHNYYYFLHTPDGQAVYARTIEEHNRNKAKYL